jgi:hypothetical protein
VCSGFAFGIAVKKAIPAKVCSGFAFGIAVKKAIPAKLCSGLPPEMR